MKLQNLNKYVEDDYLILGTYGQINDKWIVSQITTSDEYFKSNKI